MEKKLAIVFLAFLWLFMACSKEPTKPDQATNHRPEIIRLSANPVAVGMDQIVTLSVLVDDKDGDEVTYIWTTNGGRYIQGNGRKFAKWRAPLTLGEYLCKVSVSDGIETVYDSLWVHVVEVPTLQLSTEAIDFSYNSNLVDLLISKLGEAELRWKVISGKSWIKINPDSGTTQTETDQIAIVVDRTNLSPGYYCSSIMIESNGGNLGIKIEMAVLIEPVMITIPAGDFFMGSDIGRDDEIPVHKVYLDEFAIDKYEVTNAQYADFLNSAKADGIISAGSSGVSKEGHQLISLIDMYSDGWNLMCPIDFSNGKFVVNSLEANTPVRFVTWYGAKAYADFYGQRLPTEAEWEKAARGTDKREFPWGDTEPTRWDCNFKDLIGHAVMAGSYSPLGRSPYGCCDMAGNVWEWCSSLYRAYPYDATDGRENLISSEYRIIRGGSWVTHSETLRCTARCYCEPYTLDPYFGFRCAK